MCTGISLDFYNAYQVYEDGRYFAGRAQITSFFTELFAQAYPNQIVVPYSHKLYSSYLNEVIQRITVGSIEVNFTNDDADILNQLIDYEYLKDFDTFFNEPSKIDKRFTDIYPCFLANVSVNDLNKYRYIQRLVRIYLSDSNSDHAITYVGN